MNNNNLTVYKSNAVIEAGYKLTLNEQRIILACIGQVDPRKELLASDKFEVSAKEFAELFNVSEDRAYHALIETAQGLFKRYIVIDNPYPDNPRINRLQTHWISGISYINAEAKIALSFAPDLLPYLSQLKGCFTKYELNNVGNMSSIYGIRLYELLMQWRSTGKREIEIKWLKKQFEIEDKYEAIKDLKLKVIEPAIKDINTHSNFLVSWEQRKTGRTVTHLIFTFAEKQPEKPQNVTSAAPKAKGKMINGVMQSEIEAKARRGESYEQAAERIKQEKSAEVKSKLASVNLPRRKTKEESKDK